MPTEQIKGIVLWTANTCVNLVKKNGEEKKQMDKNIDK